jgi:CBS domain-containing protein
MSQPVESVLLGAPISEAVERLASAGVHGLVVVDGLSPVGIFDHNEALAARRLPPSLLEDPVEQIMCHDVITLSASTPIHRAARYSWSTKARRILVRENEQLVGIVSDLDLVDSLSRAAENKAAAS